MDPLAVPKPGLDLKPLLVAALMGNLEVFKEFGKREETSWDVESCGNNILTWLLMSKDTRKDERKSCLKWLREEKDPDLTKTINMIGSSGSTALALAGQFDWKGDIEEKDQVIEFFKIFSYFPFLADWMAPQQRSKHHTHGAQRC